MISNGLVKYHETCRVWGNLIDVMDLGELYLNAFPEPDEDDGDKYPLRLAYGYDSELLQLRHTVDPELMFRNYWYASGTQEAMVKHLKNVVREAAVHVKLEPRDAVLDIGCNDGTLLNFYSKHLYKVGFEPAKNLKADIDCLINGFFNAQDYRATTAPKPKLVFSIAMFYDVDDPVGFAQQVNQIMDKDGVWVLEMHYLPEMLKKNEFDAICHEHLTYYSLNSLQRVMRQSGMTIVDAQLNDTNGGSMLVFVKNATRATQSVELMNLMRDEKIDSMRMEIGGFAQRVEENKWKLRSLLENLKMTGKTAYGYGASTKGNTLLQYCELDSELVSKIADRNPLKHGRVTVGSRIPIISEEQMREEKPDYLLALPYHFIDSFRKREKGFKGKWIVPVPTPHVLEGA